MPRDMNVSSESTVNRIVGSVLIALVALFIFGATFRTGIHYGMDQKVGWEGYGRVLNAVAAIMTEKRFGEGGYALSDFVHGQLTERGFTTDPDIVKKLGLTVPKNLQAAFLDDVLQRTWRDLPNLPEVGGKSIRGLGGDDIGYVDFAKLAFWTFGLHVRSLYYMFFLILGISLLVALVERARDRAGQLIILITACIIYSSCYYTQILLQPEPYGSGNMINPRFMAVIGLIPTVHILLMMAEGVRFQWQKVAVVLFQAGIIFFAIHIRASAVWLIALLVLALVICILPLLMKGWRRQEMFRVLARRFAAAEWPALISILVVYGGLKVVSVSLHPIYHEGGWLEHHAFWHSVYYSLQVHPKFVEKYGAAHSYKVADEMPVVAALAYVKEHPEEDKPEIYLAKNTLKYAALERLDKLAFFQFLRRDPQFVIEVFLIKCAAVLRVISYETRLAWTNAPVWQRLALLCGLLIIGFFASRSSASFQRLWLFSAAFSAGAIASLAIPVLTVVVAQVMSEEIMAIQMALLMWGSLLAAAAIVPIRRCLDRYAVGPRLITESSLLETIRRHHRQLLIRSAES